MAPRLILHGPRPRPTRLVFYGPRRHTAVVIRSPEGPGRDRIRITRHRAQPIIRTMSWPESRPASGTAGVAKTAQRASGVAATARVAPRRDPDDAVALRDVRPKIEPGATAVKAEEIVADGDVKMEEEVLEKAEEREVEVKKEGDEKEGCSRCST